MTTLTEIVDWFYEQELPEGIERDHYYDIREQAIYFNLSCGNHVWTSSATNAVLMYPHWFEKFKTTLPNKITKLLQLRDQESSTY